MQSSHGESGSPPSGPASRGGPGSSEENQGRGTPVSGGADPTKGLESALRPGQGSAGVCPRPLPAPRSGRPSKAPFTARGSAKPPSPLPTPELGCLGENWPGGHQGGRLADRGLCGHTAAAGHVSRVQSLPRPAWRTTWPAAPRFLGNKVRPRLSRPGQARERRQEESACTNQGVRRSVEGWPPGPGCRLSTAATRAWRGQGAPPECPLTAAEP